ncbi:hypothetical protein RRG08_009634 [Elysia crispata]|uniref:Uncharacterized protein n=1 Tax=Elysia crispata TaxID=231223 RepID=A0AAE1CLR6_9GAST|nr:hypothetical protein RRG08_009634 [Elysia crispata]
MDMNALQDSGLLETPWPSFDLFWCEDQHGIDPNLSTKCSVLTYEAPDEASFYEASPSFISADHMILLDLGASFKHCNKQTTTFSELTSQRGGASGSRL